ncbi:MAG: matrixin family metalloprotease [Gemmatimonadetes bacterium]|nr:matrixin family metalloprotease [Gemmatimonadota bacterium]
MPERRFSGLMLLLAAALVAAMLWDVLRGGGSPASSPASSVTDTAPPASLAGARAAAAPAASQGATGPPAKEEHYIDLLARAETRRQIRASAGVTYLNEILAISGDSMLHRWDNRITNPVRVWLAPGTAANYQPAFLDAVRAAFGQWQDAGVPVRFDVTADSANAEVVFKWRVQFDIDRTGQTDLTWDQDGHLESGVVTLATFNQLGQPMGPDDIRVVALHEIGHLIGLDHSLDSTDLMYPVAKVRDLSGRDIQTVLLLYRLSPGSIR